MDKTFTNYAEILAGDRLEEVKYALRGTGLFDFSRSSAFSMELGGFCYVSAQPEEVEKGTVRILPVGPELADLPENRERMQKAMAVLEDFLESKIPGDIPYYIFKD
jgi:hypothetical protein